MDAKPLSFQLALECHALGSHAEVKATYAAALTRPWLFAAPTTLAQKYWITNSAIHAHWAVVFGERLHSMALAAAQQASLLC